MEPKAYYNMRVHATTKALKDAGWGTPTAKQIQNELAESTPLLRPTSSITPGMELGPIGGSSKLEASQKNFIAISNTKIFKKRVTNPGNA